MEKEHDKNQVPKIEWIGIDGGLVLLYLILAAIYTYGILGRVDFIVGVMAPAMAGGITVLTFLRYCFEVGSFLRKKPKDNS